VRDEDKEIKDKHYTVFIEIIKILHVDVPHSESTELEITLKLPY